MKVLYIKDFTCHKIGHVIDTDSNTAKFLIEKGVCVPYAEKKVEKVEEIVPEKQQPIVEKQKPKGRPKKK